MGRAPCCEKMGLKRGPWTAEEDRILVAHIEQHGHSNWRALPKQAGLLRCGKSCRLRWINYLRPDVKRGNFTREEEDAIIHLHDLLGNRWSLIAARLPGRTDNEIKNVWHTHLKKRLESKQSGQAQGTTSGPKRKAKKPVASVRTLQGQTSVPVSPEQSLSRSTITDYSMASSLENTDNSSLDLEEFQIDDSFWSETLAMTVDSSGSGMAQGTTSTPKRKAKKPVAPVSTPEGPTSVPVSPEQSPSTSSATDYSVASSLENADSFTSQEFQIDDRFWSETLGMTVDSFGSGMETGVPFGVDGASPSSSNDGMDFWVRLFMQASDMQNFSQI